MYELIKTISIFSIFLTYTCVVWSQSKPIGKKTNFDPNLSLKLFSDVHDSCLLTDSNLLDDLKSPVDSILMNSKKPKLFFDFQFLAIGKNGEASFQSMSVPRINLRDFFTSHSAVAEIDRVNLLNMPESDLRDLLNGLTFDMSDVAKEHAIDNSLLIYKLSKLDNEKTFYQTLSKEMASQSYAKKVDFLANFLDYLGDNYDFTSIENNTSEEIRVSDMEMIKAIGESIRTGSPVEAGICRHMHQLAIKMAHAMGIRTAYTVAYSTTEYGHMTMVLQDPSDPKKVVQLNYGSKIESNNLTGPEALVQNHLNPSAGITLTVFNHKNQYAITLPTEEGAILNRVTGGSDRDLSPDYKSKSVIKQVGIQTPYGTVRVFHGSSPLGNQGEIHGVAYNSKLKYSDLFYGEYGIAGFTSEKPVEGGLLQNSGAYLQTSQGVRGRLVNLPDLEVNGYSELKIKTEAFCAKLKGSEKECAINYDADGSINSGLEAFYKTGSLSHKSSFIIQSQVTQNNALLHQPIVMHTPVYQLGHETFFPLKSELLGNIGGELTLYDLGPGNFGTYNAHLGIMDKKSKTFLQLQADGRITEITPIWIPDSEKSLSGILGASIFDDKFYINLDGKKSMENNNYYMGIGLGGAIAQDEKESE